MTSNRRRQLAYQQALRAAIAANGHGVFHALTCDEAGTLSLQLANFLLEEAGWNKWEFLMSYVEGELDA